MFSEEEVACFSGNNGLSERPLPLADCASLRAAAGRACVGSLREQSAPFEFPPGSADRPALSQLNTTVVTTATD